jgi:hypothetical protein
VPAPIKIPRQRGPLAVIVGLKSKTASGWRGLWPERASAALHLPVLETPQACTNVVFGSAWTGDALVADLKTIAARLDHIQCDC